VSGLPKAISPTTRCNRFDYFFIKESAIFLRVELVALFDTAFLEECFIL
jgi:hypothetical protein